MLADKTGQSDMTSHVKHVFISLPCIADGSHVLLLIDTQAIISAAHREHVWIYVPTWNGGGATPAAALQNTSGVLVI